MTSHPQRLTAPLLIGPGNALAAVGAPWRWVRDTARELGVRFVGAGKKRFVPAAEFLAALERGGRTVEDLETLAVASDPAEAVRRALGLTRRTLSPAEAPAIQPETASTDGHCPVGRPGRAA